MAQSIALHTTANTEGTVKNNIFLEWGTNAITVTAPAAIANNTFDNNLYFDTGGTVFATIEVTARTFSAWQSVHSQDANGLNSDPLFRNAPAGNFSLQRGSPAIDAGVDVSLTQDYEGNSLVGLPDMGAYEYAVGITKPIAANLVNNLTSNLTASLPE